MLSTCTRTYPSAIERLLFKERRRRRADTRKKDVARTKNAVIMKIWSSARNRSGRGSMRKSSVNAKKTKDLQRKRKKKTKPMPMQKERHQEDVIIVKNIKNALLV